MEEQKHYYYKDNKNNFYSFKDVHKDKDLISITEQEFKDSTTLEVTPDMLLQMELQKLRLRRQIECFNICDRACWYDSLSSEQKEEVKAWRNAWLKVTETKTIPVKPDFI